MREEKAYRDKVVDLYSYDSIVGLRRTLTESVITLEDREAYFLRFFP